LDTIKPLIDSIHKALKPILVYRKKYPYPDYFKSLVESCSSISLIDEVTQGGILADLKLWIPAWEAKQIAYYNKSAASVFTRFENQPATVFPSGHLLFSVTRTEETGPVIVFLNSQKLSIRFEVDVTSLAKMPTERQPLYIKEMIYRDTVAKIAETRVLK
jgi:hypothetical protein